MSTNPGANRSYILADESGREVMLHGVCVEAEERVFAPWTRPIDPAAYTGTCPANYAQYAEPPICGVDAGKGRFAANASDLGGNDFAQIRALGLNVVRLCLSWSELEPTPGLYDPSYIARVGQIVSWAREQGVYVILDFHEDLYSLFIQPDNSTGPGIPGLLTPSGGQDGAPAWAVVANGWPALAPFGIGDLNLKVLAAFQTWYDNTPIPGLPQGQAPGPGLQDHYIGAVAALLAPLVNESTVVGVELINEPLTGLILDPLTQASTNLYPFFRRAVQALTGERDGLPDCPPGVAPGNASGLTCAYPDLGVRDRRHVIFAEPCALRNTLDFSLMDPVPWTNYSNIVHTPHVYTHVFTADQEIPWLFPNTTVAVNGTNTSYWSYPPSWDLAYTSAVSEAKRMNSAVFVTEFGAGMHEDSWLVEPTMAAAERALVTGWTLWSWKSNCNWGPDCETEAWTTYAPAPQDAYPLPNPPNSSIVQNGPLSADRERILGRTHARGLVGSLLSFHFNTSWANGTSISSGSTTGTAAASQAGFVADPPPPPPPAVTGGRTFWLWANVSAAQWQRITAGADTGSADVGQEVNAAWLEAFRGLCGEDQRSSIRAAATDGAHSATTARAPSCAVSPSSFNPALLPALSANGSVSEFYLPRSIPATYVLTTLGTNAAVQGSLTWPDGSRSVYVTVTGPGLYGVTVGPPANLSTATSSGSSHAAGTFGGASSLSCAAPWLVDGVDACPALLASLRAQQAKGKTDAQAQASAALGELYAVLTAQLHARGQAEGQVAAARVVQERVLRQAAGLPTTRPKRKGAHWPSMLTGAGQGQQPAAVAVQPSQLEPVSQGEALRLYTGLLRQVAAVAEEAGYTLQAPRAEQDKD